MNFRGNSRSCELAFVEIQWQKKSACMKEGRACPRWMIFAPQLQNGLCQLLNPPSSMLQCALNFSLSLVSVQASVCLSDLKLKPVFTFHRGEKARSSEPAAELGNATQFLYFESCCFIFGIWCFLIWCLTLIQRDGGLDHGFLVPPKTTQDCQEGLMLFVGFDFCLFVCVLLVEQLNIF